MKCQTMMILEWHYFNCIIYSGFYNSWIGFFFKSIDSSEYCLTPIFIYIIKQFYTIEKYILSLTTSLAPRIKNISKHLIMYFYVVLSRFVAEKQPITACSPHVHSASHSDYSFLDYANKKTSYLLWKSLFLKK